MRPPVRAVGDDHVDRPEVERRRRRGRPVLMARGLPAGRGAGAGGAPPPRAGRARSPSLPPFPPAWRPRARGRAESLAWRPPRRGPPLPIPNRAVKPARADGTARDGRESRSPPPCAPGPLARGAFFCPGGVQPQTEHCPFPCEVGTSLFHFLGRAGEGSYCPRVRNSWRIALPTDLLAHIRTIPFMVVNVFEGYWQKSAAKWIGDIFYLQDGYGEGLCNGNDAIWENDRVDVTI